MDYRQVRWNIFNLKLFENLSLINIQFYTGDTSAELTELEEQMYRDIVCGIGINPGVYGFTGNNKVTTNDDGNVWFREGGKLSCFYFIRIITINRFQHANQEISTIALITTRTRVRT